MPTVLTPYRIPGQKPSLKSRLATAAGAILLVLLVTAAAEITLRALGFTWLSSAETVRPADPATGTPGQIFEYKGMGPFRTGAIRTNNSLGHRAPEASAFRCARPVIAIGDSYTKGSQLADGESWPEQLALRLTDLDACIYNAGVGGAGLDGERKELEKVMAAGVQPVAVIHLFFYDDFFPTSGGGLREKLRSSPQLHLLQGLILGTIRLHHHFAWEHAWVREHVPPVDFRAVWTAGEHPQMEASYLEQWTGFAGWLAERNIRQATGFVTYYSSMLRESAPELSDLIKAHRDRSVPYYVFTWRDFPDDPMLFNDGHFDAGANGQMAEKLETIVRPLLASGPALSPP